MSSLMTIPRELRDQICVLALLAETNQIPSLNEPFEEMVASRKQYENPVLISWSSLVLGDPSHTISNATALLLVNRQLHAELQENMKRLEKQGITYELDVVVLDEILPLTTWTCVPFLTTAIKKLNITIRISGSYDVEKNRTRDGMERLYRPYTRFGSFKGFREAGVDGPAMGWQIYGILERFLRVGATHERTNKDEHKHIILKTLNINVQAPPDIDPALLGCPKSCSRGTCGEQPEKIVLDPDFLANAIARHIRRNLNCRSTEPRGSFTQCKIVFEHMEYITVAREEYEKEAFDIAELMKDVYTFRQQDMTLEDRYRYQNALLRIRRERGLRVGVEVCSRCDKFSCYYFCYGNVCENPPYRTEGETAEEMKVESSDEYEEETL